ncbi:hypothetical protein, partial [Crystallibacter crystallopoietes]|uniref:hypothetical protein n=1 Tax=Crystallibacter crystallopoietes TaxID=37928 RepID=UPI00167F51E0
QLPGIICAYDEDPSPAEVLSAAVAAGLDPEGTVDVHLEDVLEVDDIQFFVRFRHDSRTAERFDVAQRVMAAVHSDPALRENTDADRFGDVVLIAALPDDTIESSLATAGGGEPVTVASVTADGQHVSCIGVILGAESAHGPSLGSLGLTTHSTVAELLTMRVRLQNLSTDHELVQV